MLIVFLHYIIIMNIIFWPKKMSIYWVCWRKLGNMRCIFILKILDLRKWLHYFLKNNYTLSNWCLCLEQGLLCRMSLYLNSTGWRWHSIAIILPKSSTKITCNLLTILLQKLPNPKLRQERELKKGRNKRKEEEWKGEWNVIGNWTHSCPASGMISKC